MTNGISNRYEFVFLFDVENGNPNGDPDAGNMPRIDPETNHGLVTDVCLKRKVRNHILATKGDNAPYCIYVTEKAVLARQQGRAYKALEGTPESDEGTKIEKARAWMCQNFFDIRSFGAVMSLKDNNCGQVRGPIQFTMARSIDPILPRDLTITRMAVATEREAVSQAGENRTMGKKSIVPYGLYRMEGFISANLAEQTGFSDDDLKLFWDAMLNMFEHDRSAARGKMCPRRLVVFKHPTKLGSAPAHKLLELVQVERCADRPPRAYSDYAPGIYSPKDGALPEYEGVEVINML